LTGNHFSEQRAEDANVVVRERREEALKIAGLIW
jgi:hypothetical protein